MLVLLVSTAALICPLATDPLRPSLAFMPRRAATIRLAESTDENVEAPAPSAAWPEPAVSAAELQEAAAKAKEAAEAEALANPKPFIGEEGNFSVVALATVLVFVAGGTLFFQGITGSGAAGFGGSDQSPEVQTCLKQATTRQEASACLPPVPL